MISNFSVISSNKSDTINFISSFPNISLAFSSAVLKASILISEALISDWMFASSKNFFKLIAIAPLPVHKSKILTLFFPDALILFKHVSTLISVSGCGINTFSLTENF